MRHFLDLFGVSPDELQHLLGEAARLKALHARGEVFTPLAGRVLGLIFEKPSLRTRVSFETAMAQLGGASIFLNGNEVGMGQREPIADCARVLNEYADAMVLRTFKHETIEEFARYSCKPVINGLSDYLHPCQAIGDLLTMQEVFDTLEGRTVVFVGDGNNVARSLAVGCGKVGARFLLAAPGGYGFDAPFLDRYQRELPAAPLPEECELRVAVRQADVIYTDVWTSMGQEEERDERNNRFAAFQVNEQLLALAPRHARVMHCLPARRGEEITDGVMESERSVVFPQAGNRMHAQKALLHWLLIEQAGAVPAGSH